MSVKIEINGPQGSGKTTLARALRRALHDLNVLTEGWLSGESDTFHVTLTEDDFPTLKVFALRDPTNTRLFIPDLTRACVILGEVKVVAAGAMYATIETTEEQRATLSGRGITWVFDA